MKNDTSKWEYSSGLDCLLFFAQRVSELLFDYTLATYKPPTLYSTSLCLEAIRTIGMIEAKVISDKSLIPIKEELKERLPKDSIIVQILGETLEDYLKELNSSNIHEIKINLELLYHKIRPDIYQQTIKSKLEELIIENRQKNKVDILATNFIASLIDCGFSQNYINLQTKLFFFSRNESEKITDVNIVSDYFKIFSLKEQVFDVVLSASSLFKNSKKALFGFNIEIIDELPNSAETTNKEKKYIDRKGKNDIILKCNNIKALDLWSAKDEAEKKLNTVSKLFNFFHHKDSPLFSKFSIIYCEGKFLQIIGKKTSAMHKCQDYYPNIAGEKLNDLIHNFGIDSSSFRKIDKAIELHGESIKSDFTESQLLQNWIAFETLLVGYSSNSKIEQVLENLIPSLKLGYLSTLIKELHDDLIHWDKLKTISLLEPIAGNSIIDKVAQLICIESNLSIRENFYSELTLYPLLKNRILRMKENFASPASVIGVLSRHEEKVIWQIKRIYRTRNQIVHLGYVPDFTPYLVENSHNYLDIFINQIIHLVINNNQISTLEQGLKEIKICQKRHEMLLKSNKDEQFTTNNYSELIFGKGTFANTRYSQ